MIDLRKPSRRAIDVSFWVALAMVAAACAAFVSVPGVVALAVARAGGSGVLVALCVAQVAAGAVLAVLAYFVLRVIHDAFAAILDIRTAILDGAEDLRDALDEISIVRREIQRTHDAQAGAK